MSGILGAAIAAAHAANEKRACSWCRKGEGTDCLCHEDCGFRDCPAALDAEGVSPFSSSKIPVPRFR